MNRKEINGVGVDLDSTDVRNAKSVEDLKKLNIFEHLPENLQDKAYADLFVELDGSEETKEDQE